MRRSSSASKLICIFPAWPLFVLLDLTRCLLLEVLWSPKRINEVSFHVQFREWKQGWTSFWLHYDGSATSGRGEYVPVPGAAGGSGRGWRRSNTAPTRSTRNSVGGAPRGWSLSWLWTGMTSREREKNPNCSRLIGDRSRDVYLLSNYLTNKWSLHICFRGLEILTLIGENKRN